MTLGEESLENRWCRLARELVGAAVEERDRVPVEEQDRATVEGQDGADALWRSKEAAGETTSQ